MTKRFGQTKEKTIFLVNLAKAYKSLNPTASLSMQVCLKVENYASFNFWQYSFWSFGPRTHILLFSKQNVGLPEATGSESPPRGCGAPRRVRVRPGLQQLHSWLNRRLCLGRNCENLQTSLFERAANALMCVTLFPFLFVRKGGSPNSSFLFQFCKSVVVSETKVGYVSVVKW